MALQNALVFYTKHSALDLERNLFMIQVHRTLPDGSNKALFRAAELVSSYLSEVVTLEKSCLFLSESGEIT